MSYPLIKLEQRPTASLALLLAVVLFGFCGCRSFSKDPAPTIYPSQAPEFFPESQMSSQPPASLLGTSTTSPSTSTVISEEKIQAFRPIIPPSAISMSQTTVQQPAIVQPSPSAAPLPSPPPLPSGKLDELNSRIQVLEKALAEKEEQLRIAQLPKPLPSPNQGQQPNPITVQKPVDQAPATAPKPVKAIKPMPVLGIPGVLVSTHPEKEEVRIQIPDSVLFIPGSWQLNPAAEESLRKIVGEIRANYPSASLDIEGHTDNVSNDPANKTQKHDIASYKSMVVMQYFVKTLAWDAAKIKSSSHGPSRPIADNETPEGRNRNNRIEIVVSP